MPQQTFVNGEQLASVRAKLNANANDAEARFSEVNGSLELKADLVDGLVPAEQLPELSPADLGSVFSQTDLSGVLPATNPGSGWPWVDTSGLMRVGAGAGGSIPYIPSPTPIDESLVSFDGLGGLKASNRLQLSGTTLQATAGLQIPNQQSLSFGNSAGGFDWFKLLVTADNRFQLFANNAVLLLDGITGAARFGSTTAAATAIDQLGQSRIYQYDNTGAFLVNLFQTIGDSYFNGSGNVGIGTSVPAAKLDVVGGVLVRGPIHSYAAVNQTANYLFAGGSTNDFINFANVDIGGQGIDTAFLRWTRDGSYGRSLSVHTCDSGGVSHVALVAAANSHVGIGTTHPQTNLEVYGQGAFISVQQPSPGVNGIRFGDASITRGSIFVNGLSGEMRHEAGYSGYGGLHTFWVNGAELVRFDQYGKAGIGTTTPYATLSVVGNIGAYGNVSAPNVDDKGSQLYLGDITFNGSGYFNSAPGIGAVNTNNGAVAESLAVYVYTGASGSRTEVARFSAPGNLHSNIRLHAYDYYYSDIRSNYNSAQAFEITTTGAYILRASEGAWMNVILGNASTQLLTLHGVAAYFPGKVGIGTSTPTVDEVYSRLTVHANDATSNALAITNEGVGQNALVFNRTGGTASRWSMYQPVGVDSLRVYGASYGGDILTLDAGGNVGIGIGSPAYKLDVVGAIRANANQGLVVESFPTTNAAYATFVNASGGTYFGVDSSTGGSLSGTPYAAAINTPVAVVCVIGGVVRSTLNVNGEFINGDVVIAGGGGFGHTLAVGLGGAAQQNSLAIYGHSIINYAPVLSLFRAGSRECALTVVDGDLCFANTGGFANYQDSTLLAASSLRLRSTGEVTTTSSFDTQGATVGATNCWQAKSQDVASGYWSLASANTGYGMQLHSAGYLDTTFGYAIHTGSADPTVSDVASNSSLVWKNTTNGEVRHWVNDGGTMKKSAAYT